MPGRILGSIPSFVFENQHLVALPKHWKIDPNSPLSFEVKINEKNQLVLSSMSQLSRDKTNVSILEEIDNNVMC